MIKQLALLYRLPTLSREEFLHHWREVHAPLVTSLSGALGIRRYIQLSTLSDGSPLAQAIGVECDGIAEVWFDSVEAVLAGKDSAEARAAMKQVREDEKLFIDHSRMQLIWGKETEII